MLFRFGRHWAIDLFKRCGWIVKGRPARRRGGAWGRSSIVAAECQILEERVVLSTITVTSLADTLSAGNGVTLRDAIQAANTDASVDGSVAGEAGVQNVIVFQAGLSGKISLANGQFMISSSVDIQGLGAANTIIDAQQNSRIFDVTSTAGDVTLDGLILENGRTTDNGSAFTSSPGTGEGGAVRSVSTGTLTVTNSTLTGNSTAGAYAFGGALYASGALTVTNSSLFANSTAGTNADGGAIAASDVLNVTNSTLSGNSTAGDYAYGGAIAAEYQAALTNSTVARNSTSGSYAYGGAIAGNGLTVTNSTVAQNQAMHSAGGGIRGFQAGPTVVLRNTILAQNTDDGTAPDLDPGTGATITITNSLIGDNTGTALAAAPIGSPDANGNLIGTHAAPIDPRLGPLVNNGGRTQTMALLSGSPAIDTGSNAPATDPGSDGIAGTIDDFPLVDDQRGSMFNRVVGAAVDMGAFEVQAVPMPVSVSNYTVATNGLTTSVIQNGTNTVAFLNGHGSFVLGIWTSTTQVTVPAWGNDVADFSTPGKVQWSDGSVWNLSTTATPRFTVTDYTNGSNALESHVIRNDSNTVVFLNGHGSFALGAWTSTTQATVAAWGNDVATFGMNNVNWSDGSLWNLLNAAPPQITNYTTGANSQTTSVIQNGTNTVVFHNENGSFALGTWINLTQVTVPAWGNDVATISFDKVTWSDGSVWNVSMTAASSLKVIGYTIGVNSLATRVIQAAPSGSGQVVFLNAHGNFALGAWNNLTQATVPVWGNDVATFGSGTVHWSDGSVWSAAPQVTVTDYTINGGTAHMIRNGTNTVVFINKAGSVVLGTMTDSVHATVPAWNNDVATIFDDHIQWSDNSLWSIASPGNQVTVGTYSTRANGLLTHVIRTGTNTLVFINGMGAVALATMTDSTHATVAAWGNDVATFANGAITWSDGSVWF
jgi:CSLREA domain-containing protein